MTEVPAATPVTVPPVSSTVATAVFKLLHVPPATASLKVVVLPEHNDIMPVTGAVGLTVM